jgi:putative nucleotidyltransferase with HDIG domain
MIRTSDYAFRYGGDEFAILLPQTTIEAASQVTERVRESIAAEMATGDVKVTASIGLASWPEDGMSHSDIIAAADLTLYRAKWGGGNRVLSASGTISDSYIDEANVNRKESNRTVSIIFNLAEAIDSRNPRTRNHSRKVAEYAVALAKSLDLNTLEIRKLENGALLHNIGKISVSDEILDKTEDLLSDEEWEVIKAHTSLGADIVSRIPKLAQCADGIRYYHERYDGTGYPDRLKGNEIPLEARILAIADKYAVLIADGRGSDTEVVDKALEEIRGQAGIVFDPGLVEKFAAIYEKKPVRTGENKRK